MSCSFSHLDGAYVLGSLSPSERRDFEEHLTTCDACCRGVREVAGLPGLMARVDRSVLEHEDDVAPLPATLLPSLVREVRRRRRRTVLAVAGTAAAAAAAVVAVGVPVLVSGNGSDSVVGQPAPSASSGPTSSPTAAPVGMTTVGGAPVRGSIALESVPWGTRLDLTCSYVTQRPGSAHGYGWGSHGSSGPTKYEMFVRTDDGTVDMVGTWHAPQGATMRVTAATAATRDEIASVVVRTAQGQPVLRLRG
jgi:hypothetical protein